MEQTAGKACKVLLMSEKYGNNRYGDSTFNIRIPFRPNKNHVYKITINECIFKNSEPTLQKGDWIKYTFYDATNTTTGYVQFDIIQDFYTYSGFDDSPAQLQQLYKILDGTNTDYLKVSRGDMAIPQFNLSDGFGTPLQYSAENVANGIKNYANENGISPIPQILRITPDDAFSYVICEFSTNFMYLLNYKNLQYKTSDYFEYVNLRLCGAYLYVLETPIQAVVRTLNADSQTYNITALCYNPTSYHNGIVQMCSSMELTTNDLSHLRFRILNDQWEVCELREPYYLQITVSNED